MKASLWILAVINLIAMGDSDAVWIITVAIIWLGIIFLNKRN